MLTVKVTANLLKKIEVIALRRDIIAPFAPISARNFAMSNKNNM